jgi:hypothetical protein
VERLKSNNLTANRATIILTVVVDEATVEGSLLVAWLVPG